MSYDEYDEMDELDDEPYVVIERHSGSVGSFLAGIAIGAGLALLMAPQSGAETRADIGRRARDARDRARDIADDAYGQVTERVAAARGAVEDRVDRARRAVELKRRQVQSAVEAGRVAAQQAREDLERRIAQTKAAYQEGTRAAREEFTRADAARGPGGASSAAGGATATGTTGGPGDLSDA